MKPQVRYRDLILPIAIGQSARVLPLDHGSPLVSNNTWATTSPVANILYDSSNGPVFETLNTIYLPADTDEPDIEQIAALKEVPA